MIDYSQFNNNEAYPNVDDFKKITFGKEGDILRKFDYPTFLDQVNGTPELKDDRIERIIRPGMSCDDLCETLEFHGYVVKVSGGRDSDDYHFAVDAHSIISDELYEKFKKALITDLGLDGFPKEFTTWLLDYAHEHGSQYGAVNMAEIAKKHVAMMQPLIDAYRAKQQ